MQFLHRDSSVLTSPAGSRVVQIAFLGKGVSWARPEDRRAAIGALLPAGVEPAWPEQIHSAKVLEASGPGSCGEGDAVVTERGRLALTVVTADCVPVLLAGNGPGNGGARPRIAAVHAGWRGVASGLVTAAAERFGGPPRTAWIGPAISGEVYEVGEEVATKVARASDEAVVSLGPAGKEHVDLRRAVEIQLRRAGVEEVRQVERCTFRDPALWSYRRDGRQAGRNLSLVWLEDVA